MVSAAKCDLLASAPALWYDDCLPEFPTGEESSFMAPHLRLVSLVVLLTASALVIAAPDAKKPDAKADAAVPAGHSLHGEAFNEGPRQRAYLMGGTGHVHIAVTTRSADAQAFFDQGVGQLHGFWYFEAERSFRQVAAIDPDCAMAY